VWANPLDFRTGIVAASHRDAPHAGHPAGAAGFAPSGGSYTTPQERQRTSTGKL
jgi:hypothetical protein